MRPVRRFHKVFYWSVLATEEKALLALLPTRRIVPTTRTKITASIMAYSAISWPVSSIQNLSPGQSWEFLSKHKNRLAQEVRLHVRRWPGADLDKPRPTLHVI